MRRSRYVFAIIVVSLSILATARGAVAQVCPACPCKIFEDKTVQKACGAEHFFDPGGFGRRIAGQSLCTVVERVTDPICQKCNEVLDQCTDLTSKLPSLRNVCNTAHETALSVQKTVNTARRQAWSNIHSAVQKSGLNTKQDVVLYDLDGKASFSYNAYADTAWYQVTLPKGIKIEEGKVKVQFGR